MSTTRHPLTTALCVLMVLASSACVRDGTTPPVAVDPPTTTPADSPAPATPTPSESVVTPEPTDTGVEVGIRLLRTVDDAATEDFEDIVTAVLNDPRGWGRAGFRFPLTQHGPYAVLLAEGPEVDRLCHPYDTAGTYSCQIGPVVALNADRWRSATKTWPGTLAEYRTMLVNHEVGHLLGQHHPKRKCRRPGRRAAVMAPQSEDLDGCAPNPWPLRWEIDCAARLEEPLAPGYEEDPEPTCGPADVRR